MEIIRDSDLNELAHEFREREARKTQSGKDALAKIKTWDDAYRLLKEKHRYKLPADLNSAVKVAFLNRFEVAALVMRKDTVDGDNAWAKSRGPVPEPFTQILSELASVAIGRGYFINYKEPDTQLKKYTAWKQRPPPQLEGAIVGTDKCSIQLISSGQYEIIDGWGRLLPFEALLQQGCELHPMEAFVCVPPDFIFETSTRVTCAFQSV
jgi:hypothetical protein